MRTERLRVVLASENEQARHLLSEAVGRLGGAVVVGEADNSIKAMELAHNLRPDMVVVDAQLPHAAGVDGVPLSRVGGLDTAVGVSEMLPGSRVLLLNNVGTTVSEGNGGAQICIYGEMGLPSIRLGARDLTRGLPRTEALTFGELQSVRMPATSRVNTITEKGMLGGVLAIMGGLGLMFTVVLAGAGVALAAAGAAVLVLSLAGRGLASLWPKGRGARPVRRTTDFARKVVDNDSETNVKEVQCL